MDYRKQVLEMLGVEPKEEFNIRKGGTTYKTRYYLTDYLEVYYISSDNKQYLDNIVINEILVGDVEIVKIPKKIKPTKDEQIAIDYARQCGYKWLAKDKDGRVYAYKKKPVKCDKQWGSNCGYMPIEIPISFLSWEDAEPYYIGG